MCRKKLRAPNKNESLWTLATEKKITIDHIKSMSVQQRKSSNSSLHADLGQNLSTTKNDLIAVTHIAKQKSDDFADDPCAGCSCLIALLMPDVYIWLKRNLSFNRLYNSISESRFQLLLHIWISWTSLPSPNPLLKRPSIPLMLNTKSIPKISLWNHNYFLQCRKFRYNQVLRTIRCKNACQVLISWPLKTYYESIPSFLIARLLVYNDHSGMKQDWSPLISNPVQCTSLCCCLFCCWYISHGHYNLHHQ